MQAVRKNAPDAVQAMSTKVSPVRRASADDTCQASPVRDLQRAIETAYYEPVVEPWPVPVRAMILIGGSVGLWGAIAAVVVTALRH